MPNSYSPRFPFIPLYDKAAHAPFNWLEPEAAAIARADFITLTLDISRGMNTCLELVNASNLERAAGDPEHGDSLPTLNVGDTESLMRLSIASSRMLADAAEREIVAVNIGDEDE